MADHLISYLESALRGVEDGCWTFQWLSDEETTAIEQPDEESEFTVQPWIEAQDGIDPSVCVRFGERSLLLRGLLEPADDGSAGISDDLQLIIDSRRLGVGYILARAIDDGVRTAVNNVLQSRVGTFEEEIDAEGIHLFSACTYGAALSRLAQWALPYADHGGAQMSTRVSADQWEQWIMSEIGVDVRAIEINLFLPGSRGNFEPETWHLVHGPDVAVLAVPDGRSLHVASVTQSRLQQRLADRVSNALGVTA